MMIVFDILFFNSLKRRKCDGEKKHNFMERLVGAARLLAEVKLLINNIVALNSKYFPYLVL